MNERMSIHNERQLAAYLRELADKVDNHYFTGGKIQSVPVWEPDPLQSARDIYPLKRLAGEAITIELERDVRLLGAAQ